MRWRYFKIRYFWASIFSPVGGLNIDLPSLFWWFFLFCFFLREVNNKLKKIFKNGCSRLGRVGCPTITLSRLTRSSFSINSHCSEKVPFFFSKTELAQDRFILSPSCSAERSSTKRGLTVHESVMWFIVELATSWHIWRHTTLPPLVNYSFDKAALTEICWMVAYKITQNQVHSFPTPFLWKADAD